VIRVVALIALLAVACAGPVGRPATSASTSAAGPTAAAVPTFALAGSGISRLRAGSKPCGILGAAGSMWVSNFGDATVVRLDPVSGLRLGDPVPTGASPCGMAEGAGSIWTSDYAGNSATRIDEATGKVIATIKVGRAPYDAAFAGGAAWITNYTDGTVSRIDPATNAATTITVGAGPAGLAPSGGLLWVANQRSGTITEIDPVTSKVVGELATGGAPTWTSFDTKGFWVTDPPAGAVGYVDTTARTFTAWTKVGTTPTDGDVLGATAWLPDLGTGDVIAVSMSGTVLTRVATGLKGPFVLCVYQGAIWAADWMGTDIVRVDPARVGR
jgi:YVTN family beta-propeller protein